MAWGIESKLSIVLQNIYRSKRVIFLFLSLLRFIVDQILGILAAVVIIKLLQNNEEDSIRMDGISEDMAMIESL